MALIDSSERTIVFDVEANGFINVPKPLTRFWCIYGIDKETLEGFLFHDFPEMDGYQGVDEEGEPFVIPKRNGSFEDGVHFLNNARKLICHNVMGYDSPALNLFYPWFRMRRHTHEIRDTFLVSSVLLFDRSPVKGYKGVHGLEVWGARLGIRKPVINDWSTFDALKLNRCIKDVEINLKLDNVLLKEEEKIAELCGGISFTEALAIEHEMAYYVSIHQERKGALPDIPHCKHAVRRFIQLKRALANKLEPLLIPCVKMPKTKLTSHDACAKLGFSKLPPIRYQEKEVKGVVKEYPIKTVYSFTTKWKNSKKGKLYRVVVDDVDQEVSFTKLKEARDWYKENYPNLKPISVKYPNKEVIREEINDATWNHFGKEHLEERKIAGPFTKVTYEYSQMSQHQKVKETLIDLGWEPLEWNFKKNAQKQLVRAEEAGVLLWPETPVKGRQLEYRYKARDPLPTSPKTCEKSMEPIEGGLGTLIKKYNAAAHRLNFIQNQEDEDKGILNSVRPDGRVTCGVKTFATTSGRQVQYNWVNAPSEDALYGRWIRKIIKAPKGRVLIGADMPSAHPRILSDMAGNEYFIRIVTEGCHEDEDGNFVFTDLHSECAILFDIATEEERDRAVKTQDAKLVKGYNKKRKKAKGPEYGCFYGVGGNKLGVMLGKTVKEANAQKNHFLSELGLDDVIEQVMPQWLSRKRKYGAAYPGSYITVANGLYHIFCGSEHKLLNTLAIGTEAVIQKLGYIYLCEQIEKRGLDAFIIMNVHDEILTECRDDPYTVAQVKELMSECYEVAAQKCGIDNNFRSVAKVGKNYLDVH